MSASQFIDLTGHRYGEWTVLSQGPRPQWLCRCSCGTEKLVFACNLRTGKSTNCGCIGVAAFASCRRKHGGSGTRLYRAWSNMLHRCEDPTRREFHTYGGRGITVCAEWHDFARFRGWAEHAGYSDELTLDRIDNDRGYCPDNCRWADRETQTANRRNVAKTESGEPAFLVARRNGIARETYQSRRRNGWSPTRAATVPTNASGEKSATAV